LTIHLAAAPPTTETWRRAALVAPGALTPSATPPAAPSAFRNSLPAPWEINLDPAVLVPALAIGVGLIVFIPFPSSLFNSTLSTNYAEIMRRVRRTRRRVRNALLGPWFLVRARLGLAFGPALLPVGEEAPILAPPPAEKERHDRWWTWRWVGLFVLVTALLTGFLDPGFGLDGASVSTFVGILIGLVLTLLICELPALLFYRRQGTRFWPRALPATLFVGTACVLISRITDFQPGYLYGLIATVAVASGIDERVEGKLVAYGVLMTLAAAVLAWIALGLVAPIAAASSSDPLITLQTVLTMVVADGIYVAAIGMFPLSVLAGGSVRKWNKPIWLGLWFFGIVAFFLVILNPRNGFVSDTTRTPFLTTIVLLFIFSGGSMLFWAYFRRFHQRIERAANV
jgi:hypothetical protein